MRVVMLSKACVVGQYQTKLEELARLPNIKLTVLVPPFWRDERGIVPFERSHTRGYTLLMQPIRFNGQFHWHYYPTITQTLKQLEPNIVHIDEEPYNLATFLTLRAAESVNAKTLFFTWQNLMRKYPPPFDWMEAYTYKHIDHAIAGNCEAVDVLRAKGYKGQVSIIPQFGVDANHFTPAPPAVRKLFRIGYAGRLVEEKGVQILLQAVAKLDGDWELRLQGSGGPYKSTLQALVHELRVDHRVYFDSPIPSVGMPGYYRRLDALVLPSLMRPNWKEQFGRALIEAMACEVAVIGSSCGEIPNVIGNAGLIFPEGDVEALRAHLETLRDHPVQRIDLAKRGRARVLAQYTQSRIAQETYAVYQSLM
ncbi:MAG: glycosyltransferase [Chloroflexi bacterium]|nr:glycosyltransferase [Chloroflexota bacterium]